VVAGLVASLNGAEPRELEVIRPSLEDVYLALVRGHDAQSGPAATRGDEVPDASPSSTKGAV